MPVMLTHRSGETSEFIVDEDLDGLLAELDQSIDAEHPDVSIAHADGLTLSAFQSGLVVLENVETDEIAPVHQRGLSREDVRHIVRLFVRGDVTAVYALEWRPGYGT